MKYITTKEAAEKWGISERTVISYCEKKLVNEARKADSWFIPENAEMPIVKRGRKKEY